MQTTGECFVIRVICCDGTSWWAPAPLDVCSPVSLTLSEAIVPGRKQQRPAAAGLAREQHLAFSRGLRR